MYKIYFKPALIYGSKIWTLASKKKAEITFLSGTFGKITRNRVNSMQIIGGGGTENE